MTSTIAACSCVNLYRKFINDSLKFLDMLQYIKTEKILDGQVSGELAAFYYTNEFENGLTN